MITVLVLLIINTIGTCRHVTVEQPSYLIDSLKTAHAQELIANQDSIQEKKDIAINQAREKAAYWEQIAYKMKIRAYLSEQRADSISKANPQCIEVTQAFETARTDLRAEKEAISNQLQATRVEVQEWNDKSESLEKQVVLLSGIIMIKEHTIRQQEELIKEYEKRHKKNWWNRNIKWVTAAAGFGLGIMVR